MLNHLKVIISGGGTGGHIFPALSIADALRKRYPDAEILFVGAQGRMEMERVPQAGYRIIGLPVAGFDRRNMLRNFGVVVKLLRSMYLAGKTLKAFRPDVVVGVGGYASGPTLKAANRMRIPTLIQEQNSYAGVTNRMLAARAAKICVAYEGMEQFFPAGKIVMTGNPVRQGLVCTEEKRREGYKFFGLDPDMRTVLVLGGSLGARTLNEAMLKMLPEMHHGGVQFLWQSGKAYYHESLQKVEHYRPGSVRLVDFISRMDLAYSVADIIISRAGAGSISEFCIVGKPVILVPSPNVAEDHQTKNAVALVKRDAAILVPDGDVLSDLIPLALKTVHDETRLRELGTNISRLALPDAANRIVDEIENVMTAPSIPPVDGVGERFYFLGAGGIGMSALVRYFLSKNARVAGYDRVESGLTRQLNAEGAAIHYKDDPGLIPGIFRDKFLTTVVLTPAVPADHAELQWFRKGGFTVIKRAQVLGEITRSTRGLCVAGTHGKTTTSSMLAHILKQSHVDCSAFLGGILKNYDSNLLLSSKSDLTVIEADEYDRSFHWLSPSMAVITSVSPDHLDIYGTPEAYRESFEKFASLVREGGVLLLESDVKINPALQKGVRVLRYAGENTKPEIKADYYADNIHVAGGEIRFDFVAPDCTVYDVQLGVPVKINIQNAVAAMAIAALCGVTGDELRAGIASFRGACRRFDFHIKTGDLALIDDYAHHPEELSASISSIRELYPGRRLTVVFQPHLYTRTREFYREFAVALSQADEVILIPIYPAREEPIAGVSSQMILDLVTSPERCLLTKDELLEHVKHGKYEVLLMAGAGDIELLVEPVKNILQLKQEN
ncbi:MAG: UDP-N-acetylmuramate--L-alanine ligase [Dysgonamonadaceae bacterium]|jgi:UDP-N-acetylmuramate--alanine ligase|nr:UDP-N-acetylmuramate--L-alanine ligase [Dysgonamonadaceae bacterium]